MPSLANCCFAKQIDGGFQIVAVDSAPYYLPMLPQTCPKSDRPVILNGEVVNRILAVVQRADELSGMLVMPMTQAVLEFNETIQGFDDCNSNNEENEQLARLYAVARFAIWLKKTLDTALPLSLRYEGQADQKFYELIYDQLENDEQTGGIENPWQPVSRNPLLMGLEALLTGIKIPEKKAVIDGSPRNRNPVAAH